MAIKDLCFKQVHNMHGLENNNWVILEFIWKNSDTFRELIQNNTTKFCSEFMSNLTEISREILPHKIHFVRVHIKQYWHFRRVTTKQYYTKLNWNFQGVIAKYYGLFPQKMHQVKLLSFSDVTLF